MARCSVFVAWGRGLVRSLVGEEERACLWFPFAAKGACPRTFIGRERGEGLSVCSFCSRGGVVSNAYWLCRGGCAICSVIKEILNFVCHLEMPTCQYGNKCYRKNPEHLKEFHPERLEKKMNQRTEEKEEKKTAPKENSEKGKRIGKIGADCTSKQPKITQVRFCFLF